MLQDTNLLCEFTLWAASCRGRKHSTEKIALDNTKVETKQPQIECWDLNELVFSKAASAFRGSVWVLGDGYADTLCTHPLN
jgi:hypothetical protein